ncbi:MAG TPA: C4-dicarboxylate ABC transporter substrate-binding protein [Firmicutes bacterium]|nr:C4-dicarboxylate ABC transporter substrate-binding protein [Bacillota bacterium]
MKKSLLAFLAVLCVLTVSIGVYCASDLVLATGGTAGTYYPLGGAIANIANKRISKMNMAAQATGASIENIRLVTKEEADLALVQNDTADYAYNGTEAFQGKPTKSFGAVASLYPEVIQFVVRADGPIKTWADVRGKRISVGAPGSGTEANARQLLDVNGMTYADVEEQFLSFAESANQFKDGHIDGFFVTAGVPNPGITDVSTQHKIRILSMPADKIKELTTKYPFLVASAVPANAYINQPDAASTPAVMAILVAGNHVSEDDVYHITKVLFENDGDLARAHAKGAEVKLATALNGLSTPLHPGAAKYYKEKGLIK